MHITGSLSGELVTPEDVLQQLGDIVPDTVEYHVEATGDWYFCPASFYDPGYNEVDDVVLSVSGLAVFDMTGEDVTDQLTNQQEDIIKEYIKNNVDYDNIHWEV